MFVAEEKEKKKFWVQRPWNRGALSSHVIFVPLGLRWGHLNLHNQAALCNLLTLKITSFKVISVAQCVVTRVNGVFLSLVSASRITYMSTSRDKSSTYNTFVVIVVFSTDITKPWWWKGRLITQNANFYVMLLILYNNIVWLLGSLLLWDSGEPSELYDRLEQAACFILFSFFSIILFLYCSFLREQRDGSFTRKGPASPPRPV